jgi:pimeloyl-ACP methyl ester carboxylesterase
MLSLAFATVWLAANATAHPHVADRTVQLNGHALRLHFANPQPPGPRPLLVYATGDGGWHRKDLAAYKQLVSFGYPIVGFDARDYVTHLGTRETTTPGGLAADYERIISEAKAALTLPPDYPVILVGVSRGAGLAVVAAGQRTLRPAISGVVAVALTREEEYVKWFRRLRRRGRRAAPPPDNEPEMVMVYDYLPRLALMPVAVIQSTRDNYLPADQARTLFGADTPYRWLQPVQARNHSFGGARPQLYEAMRRALQWVLSVIVIQRAAGTR